MARFGTFEIAERIEHFVVGDTELGPIEAGTYEPQDVGEFVALQHLASVSRTTPEGTSHALAAQTGEPEPGALDIPAASSEEPLLPEPPPAGSTAPVDPPADPNASTAGTGEADQTAGTEGLDAKLQQVD